MERCQRMVMPNFLVVEEQLGMDQDPIWLDMELCLFHLTVRYQLQRVRYRYKVALCMENLLQRHSRTLRQRLELPMPLGRQGEMYR
jgi:hypothetical protein